MGEGFDIFAVMEGSDALFRHYFADRSSYDELLGAEGRLRAHWETFFHTYQRLGREEVSSRNEDMMRLLKENGVTYNIYGEPSGMNRPWKLDIIPFLIGRNEWEGIESGLLQRARLLDLVLADIYGERRLIKNGILPAELIYNHAGFIRPCAGIRSPGVHSLILYSADLARSKEGRICADLLYHRKRMKSACFIGRSLGKGGVPRYGPIATLYR